MNLSIAVLRQSFAIVVEREPELTRRFYDSLFTAYPQTRALFRGIDMARQARMLRDALVAIIENLEDTPSLTPQLLELGARHVAYGVTPEMYDWVGACLLRTLADVAGEDWTPQAAEAWLQAYVAVASVMKLGALRAGAVPGHALTSEPTSPH